MNFAIEVNGLSKRYGDKLVVDSINLQIRKGEIFGLLGPNGSGKTTTFRMICGLLTPTSGNGQTLGFDVVNNSYQIKDHVGYMPQKFGLYEDLSIRENLEFIGRMYQVPKLTSTINNTLSQLGLSERKKQLAGTLSGGWKQRLALAGCMLRKPQLLLLDEPTAGVDPKARRDFWEELHKLSAQGITVLVSTHYMDEAERCHRLGYVTYGKLLNCGTPQELIVNSRLATFELKLNYQNNQNNLNEIIFSKFPDLEEDINNLDGVDMVTPFGISLHISGINLDKLNNSLQPYFNNPDFICQQSTPSLEDVFIFLMRNK